MTSRWMEHFEGLLNVTIEDMSRNRISIVNVWQVEKQPTLHEGEQVENSRETVWQ